MKRFIALLLCLLFVLAVAAGCVTNTDGLKKVRVNEVMHSVFYLPQYIAIELGYFKDEGLDIELTNGNGADKSMTALISKQADIGLMGPEAAIYVYNEGRDNHAVVFGQLTKRDGSFLVGRGSNKDFSFHSLAGKEIIAGRRTGVPGMTIKHLLNTVYNLQETNPQAPNYVNLNYDIDFAINIPSFQSGIGDYVTAFEPTASELAASGNYHIAASIGQASGEVPYTAYMCTKEYYQNNPDIIKSFLRAIMRATTYMFTHTATEIAQVVRPQFPTGTVESLAAAIENYKSIDAWMSTPIMTEASFNKLQDIIMHAGELSTRVSFNSIIYNGYALELLS